MAAVKKPQIRERKLGRERADGLYHSDGLIEIDPRLKGKTRLETLIHEYIHHLQPEAVEEIVDKQAKELSDFLWRNNVRIIDADK